ncbi:leucine-rich repeat and immunoglobulin-like domain-containing nogo receptor-interacting protein 3 [Odontomachus brunneus]|uniref:leucine-rich repeat and immunoglobulin-like domain-containing nogo receptor-interacting protein 3 n=1 Tax=Odontomachus brunneus TaxID=486640 RepID=UPI0013F1FA50|nr:leucine-rich repeat and immunoglobulin-like domain-containing nogo receptor-interacting protein 3 [Odontomachus brunneus]
MYRLSFLVLACISVLADIAIAACTTSKYEEGLYEHLKCSNVTLNTVVNYNASSDIGDIMVFKSQIENIPERSFARHGRSLVSLNIQDCGIRTISDYAFDSLSSLKKLSLPYNNITELRDQWFAGMPSLEQLDLSYNLITSIEPMVFQRLRGLRRLDVRQNRLTCLEPAQLMPMAGLEKFRFSGNPLTFRCRGTLTLWLHDLGIVYKTGQRGEEDWLDSLLWLCAADDSKVADSEILMKECVIFNLFNQLRTSLTTSESYPLAVSQDCVNAREQLTRCVAAGRRNSKEVVTNGHVVRKLLRQLKESKSTV